MIQRSENGKPNKPTRIFGFLLGIELEEGTDIDQIVNALSDSVKFREGVGDMTVDILGEIEFVDEPKEVLTEWEQIDVKKAN